MVNQSLCSRVRRVWAARLRGFVGLACMVFPVASLAAEDMWELLEREGPALEIMKLERTAGGLQLYGAHLAASGSRATTGEGLVPGPGKHLSVIRVNEAEQVIWRHVYSALPSVHEVFSARSSPDGHTCIVYGEQGQGEELLNPVLLQLDPKGKIAWARREVIEARSTGGVNASLEQVANLDTIQVSATPDNGCLIAFVSRVLTRDTETFKLYFIQHDTVGTEQWRESMATQLYGRMFMLNDVNAKRYVTVQTNQSRDAAIEAMLQGVPFRPRTTLTGLSYAGEVIYHRAVADKPDGVWVKGIARGSGDSILLVGKFRSAWAGYVNPAGGLLQQISGPVGEFSAVSVDVSGGYVLAGADSIVVTDRRLQPVLNTDVGTAVTRRSVNMFLAARLPDDVPVEQIISWKPNEYLLLYKLGSRLLKVNVTKRIKKEGSD